MIELADHFPNSRRPDFYLTRLLGPKLAVLVVLLVLYLSVRHELIVHLDASTVTLGLAHADAIAQLVLFGDPDTLTTFSAAGKTYQFTRHTLAHADIFSDCWRMVLWQIERGVIVATLLIAAPPLAWFIIRTGWGLRHKSAPAPTPIQPVRKLAPNDDLALREVPPPPLTRFEPEPVDESHPLADDSPVVTDQVSPANTPVLPTAVPHKRVRKVKAPMKVDAPDVPPAPPLVQPGQVRKRPRREG